MKRIKYDLLVYAESWNQARDGFEGLSINNKVEDHLRELDLPKRETEELYQFYEVNKISLNRIANARRELGDEI